MGDKVILAQRGGNTKQQGAPTCARLAVAEVERLAEVVQEAIHKRLVTGRIAIGRAGG